MPPVFAAVAGVASAIIGGGFIVHAIVGTVLSIGLGLVANLFAPKPQSAGSIASTAQQIVENRTSTLANIPVVYGQHKVGGLRIYEEVSDGFLYLVTVFCEGPINAFSNIYIDDIAANASRFPDADIWTLLGTDDQSAADWVHTQGPGGATFTAPTWTSAMRIRGCAAVGMRIAKNAKRYPAIPVITALISGRLVYDPRDMTTKYTTNPALHIRDYYLNTRFGGRIGSTRIDDTSFINAANYFETLNNYGNGNQHAFDLNGIIDTTNKVWDNINDMMLACNSVPIRVNGKHGILALKSETSSFAFTDDNVVGGITVERQGVRFKWNKINAQFINPNNKWQADMDIVSDATYKAQDNGIDLVNELQLKHVTDWYQADHLARIALRQSRLEEKYNFLASPEALKVEIGDVVTMTHSLYGFSLKQMRVTSISIEPTGVIGIGAEEYDSTVYNVDSANPPNLASTTTFDNPFQIDPPGTPSITQTYVTNSAGFVVNIVVVNWSAPISAQIASYIVEYKLSTDTTWIKGGQPENNTFNLTDIVAGTYDFAVSAVNTIGRVSDQAIRTSVGIVDNTATPADVTGFTFEFSSGNQVTLKWDANSNVTVGGGYRLKVSNNLSGASWSDFPQLNIFIDGRQRTATLGLLQGTYMIKAENLAGIQSSNASLIPISLPDNDEWVNVVSVTESTTFAGTHTNTALSTGTLTLAATSSGGYFLSGTYGFANQIDLGGTFGCRLTRDANGTLTNTASNWDSFTGNIDDYTTVLIDNMGGNSSVTVEHWFATSTASSSGPFSSFQHLQMAETVARYLEFQTTIETGSNTENTNISQLAVHAWLKRRVEANWNVSVSSSGGTVTFGSQFYSTPSIALFPFNGAAGQYVTATTSQASRSGFSVAYFTSSGGQAAGKISWTAAGYGKQST